MPNLKIFQLLLDEKDITAMQQPESLLVPSEPDLPDSSSYPLNQESPHKRHRTHHKQDQDQDQEQEKLQDGSRRKRKLECDGEASCVEIPETPRKFNIRCSCPPRPPRKPKATPAMWLKRPVVFLDVAREVESMFPSSVLQDFGKKIKKARF